MEQLQSKRGGVKREKAVPLRSRRSTLRREYLSGSGVDVPL